MHASDTAIYYHERTKHHVNRYARSLGFMDWENQPDPFRRYHGAPLLRFPFSEPHDDISFDAVYSVNTLGALPVDARSIGVLFEHSMALSAWKEYQGARWELRCNPSSGNLHPTEGYLVADIGGAPGVFHYAPREHGIERRTELPQQVWHELKREFPPETFFVGLASIHWREAWKYGERAYRYCNHDAGHALAALSYAAAALGWRVVSLDGLSSDSAALLLGLDRAEDRNGAEEEHPDLIAAVVPANHSAPLPGSLPQAAITAIACGVWLGRANRLSTEHVDWDVIPATAAACRKPPTTQQECEPVKPHLDSFEPRATGARKIFLQRRSAVDMDGRTGMEAGSFFHLLNRTLPASNRPPWWSWPHDTNVHLALFVHRVDGLTPGLYFLIRNPRDADELRVLLRPAFAWQRLPSAPDGLYLLETGDFRRAAAQTSCMQDIAGDGAFSLGMIARFDAPIRDGGAWMYPRLFWEAGMIGQAIYLEAEAAGLRGTGIGCYFDDSMHNLLGLKGAAYQDLYHFTVGGPVDDPRLRSLPPYPAERRVQRDL